LPADFYGDLWGYKYPINGRNAGYVVRVVDRRAATLDAYDLIGDAALDKYEFVRDAYLQRRENQINDNGAKNSKPDYESNDTSGSTNNEKPSAPVAPASSTNTSKSVVLTQ
jgi:phospholipid-binding lipoprotein MlaA